MPVTATDTYFKKKIPGHYTDAVALTKSDTDELAAVCKALYVGVSGDLNVITRDGTTVLIKAAPVGILPIMIKKLLSTSTTATNVLALY